MNRQEWIRELTEILLLLPEGAIFDVPAVGIRKIKIPGWSTKGAAEIRAIFPGASWEKKWDRGQSWWRYFGDWRGWKIEIWGNSEHPMVCTARTEKKKTTLKTPIISGYQEEEIEVEVIVGWDCKEPEAPAPLDGAVGAGARS